MSRVCDYCSAPPVPGPKPPPPTEDHEQDFVYFYQQDGSGIQETIAAERAKERFQKKYGEHLKGRQPNGEVVILPTEEALRRKEVELDTETILGKYRKQASGRISDLEGQLARGEITGEEFTAAKKNQLLGMATVDDAVEKLRPTALAKVEGDQKESLANSKLSAFVRDGNAYFGPNPDMQVVHHEVAHTLTSQEFTETFPHTMNEAATESYARSMVKRPTTGAYDAGVELLQKRLPELGGQEALDACYFGGDCDGVTDALKTNGHTPQSFGESFNRELGNPPDTDHHHH